MTKNDIRLIIFDLDGTLFNSIQSIVDSLQFTAQQFGYQITNQQAEDVIGLALPIALQTVLPTDDAEKKQAIFDCYVAHNIPHSQHDDWYAGIWQMLLDLEQAGFMLAIATGKARKGLDRVLQRTQSEHLFTAMRGADEALSKPNPLMLEQILNQTGLTAQQAVMVGDSVYDMQMAENIAMPRIGVTYGVHNRERLLEHTNTVVDDVASLREMLLALKD
ncbi:HAD family hydrolase [Acinetobacter sp. c1-l78]|uniref:HAD family hydrolase n=1 Tax=Acinetobacter sp. c1-l78 TaxID=3342803 RepID=UPI0035BB242A